MSSQATGKICNPLKKIVSQNRRRYVSSDFNLDLTYITDRIIAMGYPAEHSEKFYRNSMEDIKHFLELYHSKHYLVFNLRGQFTYDEKNFDNRVKLFEMTDHHPPKLELIAPFCKEVHKYLQEDPKNIVAVHCKAGKGRTGVMICAYLVYINFFLSPRKIMDYYSVVRTLNNKGITIPSQRRYVYYFHHLCQRNLSYIPLTIELVGIYIERPPRSDSKFTKGLLKVRVAEEDIEVFCGKGLLFNSKMAEEEEEMWKTYSLGIGEDQYNPNNPEKGKDVISRRCYGWNIAKSGKRIFLEGDIRVDLFCEPQVKFIGYKKNDIKIGHVWFSTMFTCPGYCGGIYIHGDETYTYPDNKSDLVKEVITPVNRNSKDKEKMLKKSSEPLISNCNSFVEIEKNNKCNNLVKESCKSSSKIGISLNKMKEKFGRKNDDLSNINIGSEQSRRTLSETNLKRSEISHCDTLKYDNDVEYIKELEVEKPPGLDDHCPELSLKLIYCKDRQPPRYCIEEIVKKAYEKNLIVDKYNERRLSTTSNGKLIPKSPEGEPYGNGPHTLLRKEDEHVQIYGAIEVDRAYKNKVVDDCFKLIIVTRCIDIENKEEVLIAKKFIDETYKKRKERDIRKNKYNQNTSFHSNDFSNKSENNNDTTNINNFNDQLFRNESHLDDDQQQRQYLKQSIDSSSQYSKIHYHCPLKNYFYNNEKGSTHKYANSGNQSIENCEMLKTMTTNLDYFETSSPGSSPLKISTIPDCRKVSDCSSIDIAEDSKYQRKVIAFSNKNSSLESSINDQRTAKELDNSESSWSTFSSCSSTIVSFIK